MSVSSSKIKITQYYIDELEKNHIYFNPKPQKLPWLIPGIKLSIFENSYAEPYVAYKSGPFLNSIGSHSYTNTSFPFPIEIGRYCALASNITIMPAGHPIDRLTSCGLDYARMLIFDEYLKDKGKSIKKTPTPPLKPLPIIGNDVWIASDVVLSRGITIGTGAVIAAKSVVTKDVPPYALVAGIPAVIKKYRFNDVLCKKLLDSQWYNYDLADFCHLDTTNPEAFVDDFENLKEKNSLQLYSPPKISLYDFFFPKQ